MKLISKETLRALIKQKGLSYRDIGDMVGVHRSMIGQLVGGQRSSCKPDTAEKIAICLGVPREVLFALQASAASGRNGKAQAA